MKQAISWWCVRETEAVAISCDGAYGSYALLKDGTVVRWGSKGVEKIQGVENAIAISEGKRDQ